ncbi:DUF4097 family beta strand repeat-containing protein [Streptomyces roseifaciens]|uniref:DUF4097 family beta strand repeat-containing protein n=1 Tax=Streptomyces roseifaciens TaxID=1488406 RepID=UPI0007180805|nr:DUF4097 family beta strand repeat-containing protein [Streptomyces roseifaciens]
MKPRSRARSAARFSLVTAGVLAAGAALAGCGSADASEAKPESKTFALAGKELTVESDNSALEIVPADVKGVEVTRWFSGWTLGGTTKVSWELDGSVLKLKEQCSGLSADCEARHKIEVPRGVKVTVKSDNGSVKTRGFDTDLKITSDNGAVAVVDSSGALDLFSSNGTVRTTGITSARVKAGSDNGAVRLTLSRVPDRVEATSNNGALTLDLPRASYRVDARSRNGAEHVDVPRDDNSKHVVSARTGNGELKIRTAE